MLRRPIDFLKIVCSSELGIIVAGLADLPHVVVVAKAADIDRVDSVGNLTLRPSRGFPAAADLYGWMIRMQA